MRLQLLVKDHDKDDRKGFWIRAVSITSKDLNLTKAHGRYLESRLIELATTAGRVVLDNGTAPATKTLPEADRADMEYFLDQLRLMLPVLGFDYLRPSATKDDRVDPSERSPRFIMEEVGARAEAREIEGQFVVIKDSTARKEPTASLDTYRKQREALCEQGKLVAAGDGLLRFVEDVEFNSPSAAATVVAGSNRNGRLSWKVEATGETYADFKARQVEEAELGMLNDKTQA